MMNDRRFLSYTTTRHDLLTLLPSSLPGDLPVLDVGCSNGATGRALSLDRDVEVIGIELDPQLAEVASRHLSRVLRDDATVAIRRLAEEDVKISAAIFGDVLEHVLDPWECIDAVQSLMPDGGWIVASIPNVAHIDTLWNLLRGTWPMRDRGIHDDTHLRFFARRDLAGLLTRGRSSIVKTERVYRFFDRPHRLNTLAAFVGWLWPNVFTFQFKVLAEVRPGS